VERTTAVGKAPQRGEGVYPHKLPPVGIEPTLHKVMRGRDKRDRLLL